MIWFQGSLVLCLIVALAIMVLGGGFAVAPALPSKHLRSDTALSNDSLASPSQSHHTYQSSGMEPLTKTAHPLVLQGHLPDVAQHTTSNHELTLFVSVAEMKGSVVVGTDLVNVDVANPHHSTSRRVTSSSTTSGSTHHNASDDSFTVESKFLHIPVKYWIVIILTVLITLCCSCNWFACDCCQRHFCCCCTRHQNDHDTADGTSSGPSTDVAPPARLPSPSHRASQSKTPPLEILLTPPRPLTTIFEHHKFDGDDGTKTGRARAWGSPFAKRCQRKEKEEQEEEEEDDDSDGW